MSDPPVHPEWLVPKPFTLGDHIDILMMAKCAGGDILRAYDHLLSFVLRNTIYTKDELLTRTPDEVNEIMSTVIKSFVDRAAMNAVAVTSVNTFLNKLGKDN